MSDAVALRFGRVIKSLVKEDGNQHNIQNPEVEDDGWRAQAGAFFRWCTSRVQRAYRLIANVGWLHNDGGSAPMHSALPASTHFLLLQLIVAILSLPLFSTVGSMTNHAAAMSYSFRRVVSPALWGNFQCRVLASRVTYRDGYPWLYWIRKAMESKLFRPSTKDSVPEPYIAVQLGLPGRSAVPFWHCSIASVSLVNLEEWGECASRDHRRKIRTMRTIGGVRGVAKYLPLNDSLNIRHSGWLVCVQEQAGKN